jgi:hypothetical protein
MLTDLISERIAGIPLPIPTSVFSMFPGSIHRIFDLENRKTAEIYLHNIAEAERWTTRDQTSQFQLIRTKPGIRS